MDDHPVGRTEYRRLHESTPDMDMRMLATNRTVIFSSK